MKEIIKTFEENIRKEVKSIVVFPGGYSNENYLINNEYLYRRKKDYIQPFYSAASEKGIEEFIIDKNITIPCYYINQNGTKITPFIKNGKQLTKDTITNERIIEVAKKLKELHSLNYVCETNFSYFNRLIYYREEGFTPKHPREDEIVALYESYAKKYPLVPCHNDLVASNILCLEKEIFIIDFEYASNNIALFDVFSFLSENNITSKDQQNIFFEEYFSGNVPSDINQITIDFFLIHDLIWYYWSLMMFKKFHKKIYLDISKTKETRLK